MQVFVLELQHYKTQAKAFSQRVFIHFLIVWLQGFFRRRVVYRDVAALVCGSGGQCSTRGKGRIHCKLCRYNRCLGAGMNPAAIKQEAQPASHLSHAEQVN